MCGLGYIIDKDKDKDRDKDEDEVKYMDWPVKTYTKLKKWVQLKTKISVLTFYFTPEGPYDYASAVYEVQSVRRTSQEANKAPTKYEYESECECMPH